jgi:hypothetical protein
VLLCLQVKGKDLDYYALLGLQNERFLATEAQLRTGGLLGQQQQQLAVTASNANTGSSGNSETQDSTCSIVSESGAWWAARRGADTHQASGRWG